MPSYHYTNKYYYYYDATLTQSLLDKYVSTIDPASGNATTFVYLDNAGTMSHFTGSQHTPNPEVHSGDANEPTPSTETSNYENFIAAVNVDFATAWSALCTAPPPVLRTPAARWPVCRTQGWR